jgi:hypothetical protein
MEDGVEKEREPSLGEGVCPVGCSGSDNVPSDAADSTGKRGEGPVLQDACLPISNLYNYLCPLGNYNSRMGDAHATISN